MNIGRIVQVVGSIFEAEYPEDRIPAIYTALEIRGEFEGKPIRLVGEVQQHLGGGRVRAVALGSTMGIRRGMEVLDTGGPLEVPVGRETLGRVFNLLGEPIDGGKPIQAGEKRPIHQKPPKFTELTARSEMFETALR